MLATMNNKHGRNAESGQEYLTVIRDKLSKNCEINRESEKKAAVLNELW